MVITPDGTGWTTRLPQAHTKSLDLDLNGIV